MDCPHARLLLLFYRADGHSELARDDVAALETHLASCPVCAAEAAHQQARDAVVGTVVRDVPVPAGLLGRLTGTSLQQSHAISRLRRARQAAQIGIYATLALLGWGVYETARRPTLDTEQLALQTAETVESPEPAARAWLAGLGGDDGLVMQFDFRQLFQYGETVVQGRRVPCLEFRAGGQFARLYILPPGRFRTASAVETQNSTTTVRLYRDQPQPGWLLMIVHTGNSLQPFLRPEGGGA